MITGDLRLMTRSDADLWASQMADAAVLDGPVGNDRRKRLAAWLWEHKPSVGCTYAEHPASLLTPEEFWVIVDPVKDH